MKLSQKLLGLAGLAMADYACCPYDDYGMPDALCAAALREKTPFEGSDRWMDNECKAWESNVDATYEGNNRAGGCAPNNWGSCGFQRHFPWRNMDTTKNEDDALSVNEFTKLDIDTNAITAAWDSADGTALAANYNLGGLPFLGGMCKLFIPVPSLSVVQVQVAGVHKQGASLAQYPARATFGATTLDGTAYCFSVVNVHESRDNTNNINNGNVAGEGVQTDPNGRVDLFENKNSLDRQAGVAFGVAFGGELNAQVRGTDYEGEAKVGSNFDVVAHFADTWCEGNWLSADMQLAGDENSGGTDDYPINQASGFSHAHNDIMDKRHASLGYGSLYTASSTSGYLQRSGAVVYADTTYNAADLIRWPNSGAWAGFYSFVVCAKHDATTTLDKNVWGASDRDSAMSVSASDYRVGDEVASCSTEFANFRFNLRQVGNKVELCGPGQLPDGGAKRCTWNWNYNESANFGASNTNDPEGFFDRSEQMAIDSWIARKRRDAQGRTAGTNNVVAVLDSARFVFSFKDQDNVAITNAKATLTSDVPAALMTITEAADAFTAEMGCTNAGSATQRDSFPTCFTGDEVHFNLAYEPSAHDDVRKAVSPWFSTVVSTHF